MIEQSKEEEKSNNESDYIIFHSKKNFKKANNSSNQKFFNKTKYNKKYISSAKELNINNSNFKSPFTNLILREKINSNKYNKFLQKGEKNKYKLNNRNVKSSNSTKEFLVINKYKTNTNKNNLNENAKNNNKETKNNLIKNSKNNFNRNIINSVKSVETPQKIQKVSTGQQTFNEMNYINNFKNVELNFNYKNSRYKNNKNRNKTIVNIPIGKKLTKNILRILTKTENTNFKNNNIGNNNNIENNDNFEDNNNFENNNNFEKNNNTSELICPSNPQTKQANEIYNINNFINSEQLNSSKDNFDSISIKDPNNMSGNIYKNRLNKTHRLIKNRSNFVSFDEVQIDEKKNFMSIRELYRQMISAKEKEDKNKKNKSALKKKKLKSYLKKKNEKNIKKNKVFNTNLMSLEQYTFERLNKKRETNNQMKIIDYINKRIRNGKSNFYYKYNLKMKPIKDSKNELNENIFTNILNSLSYENNYNINNKKNFENSNNKRSHINILTMLELNNKYISKNSLIN